MEKCTLLVLLFALAVPSVLSARFSHVHEDEDLDMSMEAEGLHLGQPHVVAKTCFPVTMQVCLPLNGGNHTTNSTWGNLLPGIRPTPPDCKNDAFECQHGSYCSYNGGGNGAAGYWCYDSTNWQNTPVKECSHNCRSGCPAGTCTPCSPAGSHTCYDYSAQKQPPAGK